MTKHDARAREREREIWEMHSALWPKRPEERDALVELDVVVWGGVGGEGNKIDFEEAGMRIVAGVV